jgi:predicted TIM-barrel fold metal-dependent hydrolase
VIFSEDWTWRVSIQDKPYIVALEEHYIDPEVAAHFTGGDAVRSAIRQRYEDLGELRIREMDAAGIDLVVLSHGAPAVQKMEPALAVRLARVANDRLHDAIAAHPTRFAGFAMLPTPDPEAAADELERSVDMLGFKGAMVHGLTNGLFLDDKRFWPIFERAQALDVPIYLHPSIPHPAVIEAYYKDYATAYPSLLRAGWGFTVETATQAIRLVLSGAFDAYPRLKVILGHLGESIAFSLTRIDEALSRKENVGGSFRKLFCEHFYFTTSGNFSTPALHCAMMEMGADRIMFSVDWPFVQNESGVRWLESAPISHDDRIKIFGANARRLLRL